jgi:isocitrate/isopropylmalate dehydrogenase
MGQGIANLVGTFLLSVMLLKHLGQQQAIENAAVDARFHTPNLATRQVINATTRQVTNAVITRSVVRISDAQTMSRSRLSERSR